MKIGSLVAFVSATCEINIVCKYGFQGGAMSGLFFEHLFGNYPQLKFPVNFGSSVICKAQFFGYNLCYFGSQLFSWVLKK